MKAAALFKSVLSRPVVNYASVIAAFVLAALLVQVMCGALSREQMRIRGVDPVEYYVYLPSLFFDGDVNFFNEFFHFGPSRLKKQWVETETGYRRNPHGIGMAIAQSPFFVAAYLVLAVESGCFPLPLSLKYHPLFEQAWFVGNIAWFTFATFLLAWWLKRFAGVEHPLVIAVFFFLATPMLHYTFPIVPMAHGVGLATIILLLISVGKYEKTVRLRWCFIAGLCLGFVVSVRTANFVFLAYLAPHLFLIIRSRAQVPHSTTRETWLRWLEAPAVTGMGLLLGFLPQLVVWKRVFGKLIVNPNAGEFVLIPANFFRVAFSTRHGFITWHPILLIGLIGLFVAAFAKRRRSLAFSGILAVLGVWVLISTLYDWSGGWSFGHRVFIEAYPFFALGTAVVVDAALESRHRGKCILVLLVAIVAILWNVLFMIQFRIGLIPREGELTFHQYSWQKLDLLRAMLSGGQILPR